ncbi:MAG TPA: hypothetical protein VF033_06630, partial [Steroidobacteraceae bacterium]
MLPRLFVLAALSCLLVACGGGGGGGGGNVPPPSSSSGGTFTLAQSSVTFDARTDGPPVLDSSVGLQVLDTRDVAVIGAAYVAPNQPQDWLSVGITGSGANYSVDLTANWIGKAPGTYTAIISIGTTNSAGRILQRRDLTVTLTVTEITVIAEPGPYGRAATFGHSDVLHPMTIHVNAPAGRTWNVTSTVPWIHVPGATFTGIQDVELFVDSSTLSLGEHQGELRFTSLANTNDNTTRPVVVEVRPPELTLGSSLVTLGGQDGNGARETSVLATLDTGTNSYPLTLTTLTTSGGNWLTASTNSSNIGSFATALTLAAKATIGTPGRYAGAVRVDANVRGQVFTRTVDVRYNQDQDRLVAATLGVSFSRLPTRSVLRRKVRIYDSAGRSDIAWSASDDASWLSVTPGGNTGGDLELVADATNLAPGQIYYATVTVSSSSTLIDNEERI